MGHRRDVRKSFYRSEELKFMTARLKTINCRKGSRVRSGGTRGFLLLVHHGQNTKGGAILEKSEEAEEEGKDCLLLGWKTSQEVAVRLLKEDGFDAKEKRES